MPEELVGVAVVGMVVTAGLFALNVWSTWRHR